jgi:hypothetical protein
MIDALACQTAPLSIDDCEWPAAVRAAGAQMTMRPENILRLKVPRVMQCTEKPREEAHRLRDNENIRRR